MSWLDDSPRNRSAEERPLLDIQIEHGNGYLQHDPDRLLHAAETLQILRLAPRTGAKSILSGHPALTMYDTDLVLHLTPREMTRLVCRCLMPEEYFALVARFGMAFNWNADFYRRDSGLARCPVFKEGEHEYAEIMQGEAEPPEESWMNYPNLDVCSDQHLRSLLVQHPAVVTGYWQVHDIDGSSCTAADFDKLSRSALFENLLALNKGRQACLGPSEAAAREALRAASFRPQI